MTGAKVVPKLMHELIDKESIKEIENNHKGRE
jgi:hypothetical protein